MCPTRTHGDTRGHVPQTLLEGERCPCGSDLAPAPPSPATRHPGHASGSRWAPGPRTLCIATASTSSPTPQPGWRHSGATRSAGPPTSRCTSTRLVSTGRAGLGAGAGTGDRQTSCLYSQAGATPHRDALHQDQRPAAAAGATAIVPSRGPATAAGGSLPEDGQPQLDTGKSSVCRSWR